MHAVDTNVVVRYLTGDDPEQAAKARDLIDHQQVFVSRTVLLETEWVLRAVYEFPPAKIIPALRALGGLPNVHIETPELAATAMDHAEAGMDFADALHLAAASGCDSFVTFDKRLALIGSRLGGVAVTTMP